MESVDPAPARLPHNAGFLALHQLVPYVGLSKSFTAEKGAGHLKDLHLDWECALFTAAETAFLQVLLEKAAGQCLQNA